MASSGRRPWVRCRRPLVWRQVPILQRSVACPVACPAQALLRSTAELDQKGQRGLSRVSSTQAVDSLSRALRPLGGGVAGSSTHELRPADGSAGALSASPDAACVPAGDGGSAAAEAATRPAAVPLHLRLPSLGADKEVSIGDCIAPRPSLPSNVPQPSGSQLQSAVSLTSIVDSACSSDLAAAGSWLQSEGPLMQRHSSQVGHATQAPSVPPPGPPLALQPHQQQQPTAPAAPGLGLRQRRPHALGLRPVVVEAGAGVLSPGSLRHRPAGGDDNVSPRPSARVAVAQAAGRTGAAAAPQSPARALDSSRHRAGACPLCNQTLMPQPSPRTTLGGSCGMHALTARGNNRSPQRMGGAQRSAPGGGAPTAAAAAVAAAAAAAEEAAEAAAAAAAQQQAPGPPLPDRTQHQASPKAPEQHVVTQGGAQVQQTGRMARSGSADRALSGLGHAFGARDSTMAEPLSLPASPKAGPSRKSCDGPSSNAQVPDGMLAAAANMAASGGHGVYTGVYANVSLEVKFTHPGLPALLSKLVKVRRRAHLERRILLHCEGACLPGEHTTAQQLVHC